MEVGFLPNHDNYLTTQAASVPVQFISMNTTVKTRNLLELRQIHVARGAAVEQTNALQAYVLLLLLLLYFIIILYFIFFFPHL
jgi:hypothetical protein